MEVKGTDHRKKLSRINRIEGQVRGVGRMIEEDKYCIDILTQVKAIKSALKSLEIEILEDHMNCCLRRAIDSKSQKDVDKKLEEILSAIKRVSRS